MTMKYELYSKLVEQLVPNADNTKPMRILKAHRYQPVRCNFTCDVSHSNAARLQPWIADYTG